MKKSKSFKNEIQKATGAKKVELISSKPKEINPEDVESAFMRISRSCSEALLNKKEHSDTEQALLFLSSVLVKHYPPKKWVIF